MSTTVEKQQHISLSLTEGAVDRVSSEPGIVMIWDSSQEWFWTPGWQAGERIASREIAEGLTEVFEDADAFLASLD